jgi:hypothetical protein
VDIDEARRRVVEEIRTGVHDDGITDGQRFLLTPKYRSVQDLLDDVAPWMKAEDVLPPGSDL